MENAQRPDRLRLERVVEWANANAQEGDEWDPGFERLPSTVRMTEHSREFVLYAVKTSPLVGLFENELPPNTPLVVRFWPTPAWGAQLVSDLARRHGSRVRFVGDLDPLDLLTFFALGATLDEGVILEHVGVGERWLRCLRLEPCLIAMSPFEKLLWREVRQLADWPSTVGPDAVAMLDGGQKVETDGAMNSLIQTEDILESMRRDILGR
jgi:hypothetical protein